MEQQNFKASRWTITYYGATYDYLLLANLVGILVQSPKAPVAVAGDIEAMYNEVRVHPDDQHAQRFLWRRPGSDEEPKVFQMLVKVFGLILSPTACLYALQHAAEVHGKHSAVINIIRTSFYEDNFINWKNYYY